MCGERGADATPGSAGSRPGSFEMRRRCRDGCNTPVFDHARRSAVPAAGESAMREYEDLRAAWIVRNRKFFRLLHAIVALIIVLGVVVWHLVPGSAWYCGLVSGAVLSFDLALRMSPPAWIESWQTGGIGEERTGRALRALSGQWSVIHDWRIEGRGNVDHVIVGPAGVFAVETKNIGTEIRVEGDTLLVFRPDGRRRYAIASPARQARANAAAVSRALRRAGEVWWVQAVLVVWGDFPQRVVVGNRVVTVHGAYLADWLNSLAPLADQSRLPAVRAALANLVASPPRSPVATARRRWRCHARGPDGSITGDRSCRAITTRASCTSSRADVVSPGPDAVRSARLGGDTST